MLVKKSPVVAFLLSLGVVGLGLFYVGRKVWAAVSFCTSVLVVGLVIYAGLISKPLGVWLVMSSELMLRIVPAIWAAVLASKPIIKEQLPGKMAYFIFILLVVACNFIITVDASNALRGFKTYICSEVSSMTPTLSGGDYIISIGQFGELERGDIVVFKYKGGDVIHRIAALPGDIIYIEKGHVIVNGRNMGLFHAKPERAEERYSQRMPPVIIRKGHVFLLGDNRDNSNDSRFMGQVPIMNVIGKITGIAFSPDLSRMGTLF